MNIRQVTDVPRAQAVDARVMRIEISLDGRDPPTGHVVSGSGGEHRPFAGWLGLLAALAELVDGSGDGDEMAASRGASGGEGSELDP